MKTLDAATLETLITSAMQSDDWATVQDLEPRLDAATHTKKPPPIVSAALFYAEMGLRVFPLQPRRKLPHKGSRGCKEATDNLDTIRMWWQLWPDSNLAIATGHLVDVIDIDGPQGVIAWARMKKLPDALGTVSTPRWDEQKQQPRLPRGGGTHIYVTATGRGNKAAIFPGVDYRGQGGYVVAPPSVMPDGSMYRWRRPLELT